MLVVHEPRASIDAAGLQQLGISLASVHQRFEARHRVHAKQSARKRMRRHQHFPIDESELPVAAKAALVIVLNVRRAVQHQ